MLTHTGSDICCGTLLQPGYLPCQYLRQQEVESLRRMLGSAQVAVRSRQLSVLPGCFQSIFHRRTELEQQAGP